MDSTSDGSPGDVPLDVLPGSHLTYRLAKAQHRLEREIDRALDPEGVTLRQFSAMAHIASTSQLSSADLARALLISPQAAGALVQRLSAAGLVEQTTGVRGSAGRLHLTPEGLTRLRSAERVATAAEERALRSLPPEKRRHLEDALLSLLHDTGNRLEG